MPLGLGAPSVESPQRHTLAPTNQQSMPSNTKKSPAPHIYLFHGHDTFSLSEKIAAWKNRFAKKYSVEAISDFDCEEMVSSPISSKMGLDTISTISLSDPLVQLKNALSGKTLFSATSLVIVRNVFSKKAGVAREMLCQYLPTLSGETFCVLVDEKRDPKSELSKLLTQLSKGSTCSVEEFIIPAGPVLKNWIVARTKKTGGSFDPRALAFFTGALEHEPPSLWHCDNEIKKLVSYSTGNPITVDDIRTLSCLPTSAHVFNLSDALLGGNITAALKEAHCLTPLLRALAFLMTQFRSFLVLKNMEEDGQPEEVIAETLSWNPRRVWVVRKKLEHHTTQSLKAAYTGLLDLERIIKTGSADPVLSLDLFVKKTTEPAQ